MYDMTKKEGNFVLCNSAAAVFCPQGKNAKKFPNGNEQSKQIKNYISGGNYEKKS